MVGINGLYTTLFSPWGNERSGISKLEKIKLLGKYYKSGGWHGIWWCENAFPSLMQLCCFTYIFFNSFF